MCDLIQKCARQENRGIASRSGPFSQFPERSDMSIIHFARLVKSDIWREKHRLNPIRVLSA